MSRLEVCRRLRRAAETISGQEKAPNREEVLCDAWELLNGLRSDDFPEELRPLFDYLNHEISSRKGQEMTQREIDFLLSKIRELDSQLNGLQAPDSEEDNSQ
jgi:hypothetical protein